MLKGGITNWLWDAMFPQFCLLCEQEGALLCVVCERSIELPGLVLHTNNSVLGIVRSAGQYDPASGLGKLIEQLKYHYAAEAAGAVQRLVYRFWRHHVLAPRPDYIIPIPLHRRRLAERGFNQASVIAFAVAAALAVPLAENALVRARATKQQVKLNRAERLKNTQNAFAIKKPALVAGRHIWLIDDVYTTGSTMQAAAQVLRAAGATVNGFTLARG